MKSLYPNYDFIIETGYSKFAFDAMLFIDKGIFIRILHNHFIIYSNFNILNSFGASDGNLILFLGHYDYATVSNGFKEPSFSLLFYSFFENKKPPVTHSKISNFKINEKIRKALTDSSDEMNHFRKSINNNYNNRTGIRIRLIRKSIKKINFNGFLKSVRSIRSRVPVIWKRFFSDIIENDFKVFTLVSSEPGVLLLFIESTVFLISEKEIDLLIFHVIGLHYIQGNKSCPFLDLTEWGWEGDYIGLDYQQYLIYNSLNE
ncbi:hypothetical protein H8356DRAFT_1434378 [Neocallimastix lanati (nom. inval.)]|nr:hypothetical protein H8356DRAFT_1434378 [Neocallimastix sp. JGI-2020a]